MTRPFLFGILVFVLATGLLRAQDAPAPKIYDPAADAQADLAQALRKADLEGKHVLVQVGGNWCSWCLKLEKLFASSDTIKRLLQDEFVFIHVNYSKENKNLPVLERLGFPQRFGFPALVVLDAKGVRLHTQDSGLLEENKGHSAEKVLTFLSKWTKKSLDPVLYRE